MEQHYLDKMEELRTKLLETIPSTLIDVAQNSQTNSDADLDQAMDFLSNHASKDDEWRNDLVSFVALKESSEALAQNKVLDFPRDCLDKLLAEPSLLEDMLVADGASGGNYGKAMEIYQEIMTESDAVHDSDHPILPKLALAIALVHSTPVEQTNPVEPKEDAETVVDPIRRYLNYECAYIEGELDPCFATLSTWELTHVVNGDEPDEVAAWGRRTLRNFYPDHALEAKPDWLYAAIVRTDIPYGSSRVSNDDPKLHKYQNILCNGGICGRRAFFGRFILRAFGIPTTARPSKGHAALCHYKPDDGEWGVNLGGKFGKGWTKTRYVKDLDFQATTQARNYDPQDYRKVKLAQWIGEIFDEKRVYGIHSEKAKGRDEKNLLDLSKRSEIGLWYRLSLKVQESILAKGKAKPRKASGVSVDTVIETSRKQKSKAGQCSCQNTNGKVAIAIPASSYANPRKTKDVKIMKSITSEETDSNCGHSKDTGCNQQIYLPPFNPEGTTIMRGGSWKGTKGSGHRLLSDGRGKYDDWGLRAAMTLDNQGEEDEDWVTCPEPNVTLELKDGITIDFVYIPPGTFVMGGKNTEDGRFKCVEVPHHPVELTKGFYMGKYPVTQDQYAAMMKGKNPSKSTKDPKCPVDNVGVQDALAFCEAASEATGANIRLPTEAEWEYSSRGSTQGTSADPQWFFGKDTSKLVDYAWIKENAGGKSHPVGLKEPNPFGLYDVYGNILERISDTYHKDYYGQGQGSPMVDPTGPSQGTKSKLAYEIKKVPEAGKYSLTAIVCTINPKQRLRVSTGDEKDEGTILELPYTVGSWEESKPISLQLKEGDNKLRIWRDAPPQYGVSIQEFVLTKVD